MAPAASAAVVAHAAKSIGFLESKLPPPGPTNLLAPTAQLSTWTDQQVDAFSRYFAAVNDPGSVVDDLKARQLSPEGVETLKVVYPQTYDEIRKTAIEEIAKHGLEMPYDAVLQMSLLLDIPGHPTLDPTFLASVQSMWSAKAKATRQGPSPSNTRPLPPVQKTESERLMGGLSQ